MIQGRGPSTAAVAGHRPPTLLVPSFLRGFERPLVLVRIWNLTRGSPRCFCRERGRRSPPTRCHPHVARRRGDSACAAAASARRGQSQPSAGSAQAEGRAEAAGRGHRTLNPLAPRGGQRGGRAVSRDAGRWGSRVRSCVCPGPLQPRRRPRFPLSPRALPTAGDSCGRGSGHCRLLPTAAVPRTLPPSPFGDNRACPLQGRAEGQKFFPRDACPPAAPRSDGGRVRFFELASPVPGPPTSRPAVRTAWAHGAVLDGQQTRPGVKPRLLKLLKTELLQVFFF